MATIKRACQNGLKKKKNKTHETQVNAIYEKVYSMA